MKFGKLEEVDVRELWKHEQYDFSNWLAKEENIEYLNEILGLTLVDVNKEVFVGSYRCDLVAKDDMSNDVVIIENQLEASNHDHLGKIITYASGLDANTVVWIVKEAREEHRSAIEWLNNNTGPNINFFLLELHAYKIGDSLPAPKFEIVEKPNGFIKNSKSSSDNKELDKSQAYRFDFWNKFNDLVIKRGRPINVRKATTDHWYDVAIGTSEAHVTMELINKDGNIGVSLYINDSKELFDKLESQKDAIQDALGFDLIWARLDGKKSSRIKHVIPGLDFENQGNYDSLMNEMLDKAIAMRDVFKKYI